MGFSTIAKIHASGDFDNYALFQTIFNINNGIKKALPLKMIPFLIINNLL